MKKTLKLHFVLLSALLFVCLFAAAILPAESNEALAYDTPVSAWQDGEFSSLHYGIYWYEKNNDIPVIADKATNYDPTKPTIVFAHGMKTAGEGIRCREGLSLKSGTEEKMYGDYLYDPEFYNILIDKGYNVGMFYWNQLAYIPFTNDIRIWCVDEEEGMTYAYRAANGDQKVSPKGDETNPKISVAGLYRDCLLAALGQNFSGHLQLIGHSMGGQLTLAVTQALCYSYDQGLIGENYLPDRITLLDPFIGYDTGIGVVDTTDEIINGKHNSTLAAEASEVIAKHNIPIESFGANKEMVFRYFETITKIAGVSGEEERNYAINLLCKNIVWVYIYGMQSYYGAFPAGSSHVTAVDYYFTTVYEGVAHDKYGLVVPSFDVSDEQILQMRGMAFIQSKNTAIPNADPLYQSQSVFEAVEPISQNAFSDPTKSARITGTAKVIADVKKDIAVRLYSGETLVDEKDFVGSQYYFDELAKGEYLVRFFDGETEVGESVGITVEKDATLNVADDREIVFEPSEETPKELGFFEKIAAFFKDLFDKIAAFFRGLFNK